MGLLPINEVVQGVGKTKVCELDSPTFIAKEDVSWFEIAMNHTLGVSM